MPFKDLSSLCHVASSPRTTTSTASSVQCSPCPVPSAHKPTLPFGVHHFDDVVGSSSLLCTDIHCCWGWSCPLTFVEASVEHISKGLSALLNIDTTRYCAWCGAYPVFKRILRREWWIEKDVLSLFDGMRVLDKNIFDIDAFLVLEIINLYL